MKEGLVSPWTGVILEVKDSYAATTVLPPEQGSFPSDPDLGSGPNRAGGSSLLPSLGLGATITPFPSSPRQTLRATVPPHLPV